MRLLVGLVVCAAALLAGARAEAEGLAATARTQGWCIWEGQPMSAKGSLTKPDSFWKDLALFAPDRAKFKGFGHGLQVMSDCAKCGDHVAYDWFPVHVEKLPTNAPTPDKLLDVVAADLALWDKTTILNQAITQFKPWDATHVAKWANGDLKQRVGTWFHLNMPVFPGTFGSSVISDQAAVVCTRFTTGFQHGNWVFSTAYTISDALHPVTGHREFGFRPAEGGQTGYYFYTRGVDRLSGCLSQYADKGGQVKPAQMKLWQSLQKGIADYVNARGGKASVPGFYSTEKNFKAFWTQFTVPCFRHENKLVYKLPEQTDDCECTNFVTTCGADTECRPTPGKGCRGKCVCGRSLANECFCVKGAHESGRECDPWNIKEL